MCGRSGLNPGYTIGCRCFLGLLFISRISFWSRVLNQGVTNIDEQDRRLMCSRGEDEDCNGRDQCEDLRLQCRAAGRVGVGGSFVETPDGYRDQDCSDGISKQGADSNHASK